jgi:hypothetical protein
VLRVVALLTTEVVVVFGVIVVMDIELVADAGVEMESEAVKSVVLVETVAKDVDGVAVQFFVNTPPWIQSL